MQITELLALIKLDLQITSTAYDNYLINLLNASVDFIEKEGITLNFTSIADNQLIVMYAAYLFRKRTDEKGAGMPRMLRYALNNRLFSEKAGQ